MSYLLIKYNFRIYLCRLYLCRLFFLKNLEWLLRYNMYRAFTSSTELKTMETSISVSLILQHNSHSTEHCILIYILIKLFIGGLIAEHSEDYDFILFWKTPSA